MHAILPFLLLLTPALAAVVKEVPPPPNRKKLSAVSVLPDGSQMQGVMFPRYDEQHRLIGVLKAKEMTLVDADSIAGTTVAIEFFHEDGSARGRIDLKQAIYHQAMGMLNAKEPVTIHSDRLYGEGTALCYAFNQGEGFLSGPATTWIQNPTETTMHPRHSSLLATASIGASLLAQPLAATPPAPVSQAEIAAIHSDATATTAAASEAAMQARTALAQDTESAAAGSKAASAFIAQAGLPFADADPPLPEAQPLAVKPGPADTVITCDGGVYFDVDQGVLVYLKNVRVTDPRFELTGANKLQIFLTKKPEASKNPKNPKDSSSKPGDKKADKPADATGKSPAKDPLGGGLGAKFGDVDHLVASGAVRFLQKQAEPGKAPIEASGAVFTYHTKTGQIIISGGYPWVKQGPTYMRAEQPNLNLRILKSGSFVTEGKWVMGGPLQQGGKPLLGDPQKPKSR